MEGTLNPSIPFLDKRRDIMLTPKEHLQQVPCMMCTVKLDEKKSKYAGLAQQNSTHLECPVKGAKT
jgi:hypothetical protein